MAIFTVPIIPADVAKAIDAYRDGEMGLGPKVPCPNVQPRLFKVAAASKREAANLALKRNPGWFIHPSNIMQAHNA
jgi:hypothetical protein